MVGDEVRASRAGVDGGEDGRPNLRLEASASLGTGASKIVHLDVGRDVVEDALGAAATQVSKGAFALGGGSLAKDAAHVATGAALFAGVLLVAWRRETAMLASVGIRRAAPGAPEKVE